MCFPTNQAEPSTSTGTTGKITGLINYCDASLESEILWLAKSACSNYSLQSSDHIDDLFRTMFPDSKIAANFTLGHTSSSYIIGEGLSPYFTYLFINDPVRSGLPFSLHFDETTTTQARKQMDLTLRYWSATHH